MVTIANRRGLHARAAAKFVECATRYDAEINVAKDGAVVCGTSIMGLMMLAATPGSKIEIQAAGRDARAAVDALITLIANRFDED